MSRTSPALGFPICAVSWGGQNEELPKLRVWKERVLRIMRGEFPGRGQCTKKLSRAFCTPRHHAGSVGGSQQEAGGQRQG